MFSRLVMTKFLGGMLLIALVACGSNDEATTTDTQAKASTPTASAPTQVVASNTSSVEATATVEKTGYKGGPVAVDALKPADLSNEGDTVDLTIKLWDGTMYVYGTPPYRWEPKDMTFRIGQTVNFTLEFADPDSRLKHTFNVPGLGIDEKAKYGKSHDFTYTFDKAGTFHILCAVHNPMTGVITVQ